MIPGTNVACRTGVIFLRMLGEQTQKRGEHKARVTHEGKSEKKKKNACAQTIVQAVPAFKYECGYPIGYFTSHDP